MPMKIRPIRVEGNLAFITLTRGHVATIDAVDVPLVSGFHWCAKPDRNTVYAMTKATSDVNGKRRTIYLHRQIMAAPDDRQVDHLSGDGLDNRRDNLRLATHAQNCQNQRLSRNNKSGLKGVSWYRDAQKWCAQIEIGGKHCHLGLYATAELAHAAYSAASARYHGEFGRVA